MSEVHLRVKGMGCESCDGDCCVDRSNEPSVEIEDEEDEEGDDGGVSARA